jgi:hypothetical protein
MAIDTLSKSLKDLIEQTQELAKTAHAQYLLEVDNIIENNILDANHIEKLLDNMLDFCFYNKIFIQYRRLCHYYYDIDRHATADYINAYRELWDSEDDNKIEN